MPIGNAIDQTNSRLAIDSTIESSTRLPIRLATDWFQANDWPRSPCSTTPLIQVKYCTRNGLSSP